MQLKQYIFVLGFLFIGASSFTQTSLTVSGSVVNYAGAPIPDANVRFEYTCKCGSDTNTNQLGDFQIKIDTNKVGCQTYIWVAAANYHPEKLLIYFNDDFSFQLAPNKYAKIEEGKIVVRLEKQLFFPLGEASGSVFVNSNIRW